MEPVMGRSDIEKALGWMKPRVPRRVQGRRIKVYAASLNLNFYLKNPSGRQLSNATLMHLAYDGVTVGWKKGAEIWPRDVYLVELNLKMLAQSQRASRAECTA
jgi:hypothetical protein